MLRAPVIYISHGSPTFAVEDRPVTRAWTGLGQVLSAPSINGVLVVSAHWTGKSPTLSGGAVDGGLMYDFYGFPAAMYELRWPSVDATGMTAALAGRMGLPVVQRPFDHGVWVPLMRALPQPTVPVVQLSLDLSLIGPEQRKLGGRLAALRDDGIVIVGSGGIAHNLRRVDFRGQGEAGEPWVDAFMAAWTTALETGDTALLDTPHRLPHGSQAAPDWDHYAPFLVAHGAADGDAPRLRHQGFALGTLDTLVIEFG